MPPQRTPLCSISGNRTRGLNTSPYIRGKIKGIANRGASISEIQARYKVSRLVRRGSIALDIQRPNSKLALYSSYPPTYTDRDD